MFHCSFKQMVKRTVHHYQDWETNILTVRLVYSYSIVLIILIMFVLKTLIKSICKVRILVRLWPDSPGWFPQPWLLMSFVHDQCIYQAKYIHKVVLSLCYNVDSTTNSFLLLTVTYSELINIVPCSSSSAFFTSSLIFCCIHYVTKLQDICENFEFEKKNGNCNKN